MRHGLKAMLLLLIATVSPALSSEEGDVAERRVEVIQTPDGGIQPQAVIDGAGTIHLVYFQFSVLSEFRGRLAEVDSNAKGSAARAAGALQPLVSAVYA